MESWFRKKLMFFQLVECLSSVTEMSKQTHQRK